MTEYLLAVHSVEGEAPPSPDEMQAAFAAVDTFNARLRQIGAWVFAGGLEPATTATVVTSKGGKVVAVDGPFAETKEQLGGFWVIEAPDRETALALAAEAAEACRNPVEVRPFQAE